MEVYNATDEPVHFFKHTTLEILIRIQEMRDIKLEIVDANTVQLVKWAKYGLESSPQSHFLKRYRILVDDARQTLTQEQRVKFH